MPMMHIPVPIVHYSRLTNQFVCYSYYVILAWVPIKALCKYIQSPFQLNITFPAQKVE